MFDVSLIVLEIMLLVVLVEGVYQLGYDDGRAKRSMRATDLGTETRPALRDD